MRFLADGPNIPDELLVARDEGRVLFFCGAGVSRAKAGLPSFLGLATKVLQQLHVSDDSPAQKFMKLANELEPIPGVGGVLAADRIFGLLERDFSAADIAKATGRALMPVEPVNLSAHKTLLDLSRDANGNVRLITTNFDLLFERVAPKAPVYTPNRLPQIRPGESFSGIVHLHGMMDRTYTVPVGGHLVLSSAEFGRAYLAEGWATEFIRAAIKNYLIVFVGYAAEDPPLQYLLEALDRLSGGPPRGMYAFQSGSASEAQALWVHKGVQAIPYTPDNGHAALWQTLEAWAGRARNPERWRDQLLRRAHAGPQAMQPHERGQVVHLAATEHGARAIAQAKRPLPATWLSAFDPIVRFGRPSRVSYTKPDEPEVDPFNSLGIDSDPVPHRTRQPFQQPEVPKNVSDIFQPTEADGMSPSGRLRGGNAGNAADLPPRLVSLAVWLGRVCGEPAAIWWASEQVSLHATALRQIRWAVEHQTPALSDEAARSWRYMFEAWNEPRDNDHTREFELHDVIKRDGWTPAVLRRFGQITRGILTVSRTFGGGPLPPAGKKQGRVRDILNLDVSYPQRYQHFEIPAEYLPAAVRLLRQNIEYAVDLEREILPITWPNIAPIEPDPDLPGESSVRAFGINAAVSEFVAYFRLLVTHDVQAARNEVESWRGRHDPVFGRLRVWAAGIAGLVDDVTAANLLLSTDERVFWGSQDQRDVLLSLRNRWGSLPEASRQELEARILAGPTVRHGTAQQKRIWKAGAVLDRVTWLREEGCAFSSRADKRLLKYRADAPDWRPESAAAAARSQEGRGGSVVTDRSIDGLASTPLSQLIPRALAGQRRVWGELQEYDPFAGLCEKRPVRLLAALELERLRATDVVPLWTTFLYSAARRNDRPKLKALICQHLLALPNALLDQLIMPATYWLDAAKEHLYQCDRLGLEALFDRMSEALERLPTSAQLKELAPGEERDWVNLSFGAAAGHLAETIIGDPALVAVKKGSGFAPAWLQRATRLLDLPGDQGLLALVQFARHLGWFEYRDPDWAGAKIAAAFFRNDTGRDAALAGFFTNARLHTEAIYRRLKPVLIQVATAPPYSRRRDTQALAQFFAGGWLSRNDNGNRWLSDEELRDVLLRGDDDLRTSILWQADHFNDFSEKLALIREVWPLQLAARGPVVVGRLATIAFDDDQHFVELAAAVLPLVAKSDASNISLPLLRTDAKSNIDDHPREALELLAAILPEDVAGWPYGVDQTLQAMAKADPGVATDPRWLKLKRIWDSR